MPRTARRAIGGEVYHVINRGNGRAKLFHSPSDYTAFVQLLLDALTRAEIEIFAFCLMPNHWHLVLRPTGDRDLARFMSWLTNTHVKRYRARHRDTSGHLYQGRYKSFIIERDEHLLIVLRYVDANALRARLVGRAQDWRWCSLGCASVDSELARKLLSEWPIDRPMRWTAIVNAPMRDADVTRVKTSIARERPFGSDAWSHRLARALGKEHTLRPRGRPRKMATPAKA
jgi:putative transposase